MNSMHKLSDTQVRHGALTQQSRQRKIDAWLQVAASLSEQITVELQTATEQLQGEGMADLQRVTALAQRLASNSKAMRDTLGTLFDSGEKSEEHAVTSTEDCAMDEQVNTLGKDMASVKLDVKDVKADVTDIKVDVADLKTDVADIKVDVAGLKTDVAALKTDVGVLKTDVSGLKLDLAVVRSNYATKSDVAEAKSAVILSCVGTIIAMSGVAFAVARLVH
jgi:chromosome segregation ATPase